MNINFKLNKADYIKIALVGAIVFIVYMAYGHINKGSRCERSCEEFKSEIIGGACYCKTDVGFIRAGQVEYTLKKLELVEQQKKKGKRR